jgi:hypothetical protein
VLGGVLFRGTVGGRTVGLGFRFIGSRRILARGFVGNIGFGFGEAQTGGVSFLVDDFVDVDGGTIGLGARAGTALDFGHVTTSSFEPALRERLRATAPGGA